MILLYHSVFNDESVPPNWFNGPPMTRTQFIHQIQALRKWFTILPLDEYLQQPRKNLKTIAITFDDGLRHTFENVYPFLESNQVPVTIFVSTAHLNGGRPLWFSYLNGLCTEGVYEQIEVSGQSYQLDFLEDCRKAWQILYDMAKSSGDPGQYCSELAQSFPLPEPLVTKYMGMSDTQFEILKGSKFIQIGAHTDTHPFLDQIPEPIQVEEIQKSKEILIEKLGKSVQFFAYPSGTYNEASLEIVRSVGFKAAFAVTPKNLGEDSQLEVERIGVYSDSLLKLYFKALGGAKLLRRLGIRVG